MSGIGCIGFRDKLYWRCLEKTGWGRWHCFKKVEGGGFQSLCGFHHLPNSLGQKIERPIPELRCARCDIAEMKRRGWQESGPETRGER